MRHARFPVPSPIAEPDGRFRSLAPQLLSYPHLPANAVETILDALAAAGPDRQLAAFLAMPSTTGPAAPGP